MKLKFLLSTVLLLILSIKSLQAQYVAIPDSSFRAFLETTYPSCMSGGRLDTTCSEILTATDVDVSFKEISDLTGIQYFDNLDSLNCKFNYFSSLPRLPLKLSYLECSVNNLVELPILPKYLKTLSCNTNQLISLPNLPSGLLYLDCSYNQIPTLPSLPDSLVELNCELNLLSNLPVLPNFLDLLHCSYNKLDRLPTLPNSLTYLGCGGNNIFSLPPLPENLFVLICANNQLTSLPTLPSKLGYLNCKDNKLYCLPILPEGLFSLAVLGNMISCIPNLPPNFSSDVGYALCNSSNLNNCLVYPTISGRVIIDTNNDGKYEDGEEGLPGARVRVYPGSYITTTDNSGFFALTVDTGAYKVELLPRSFSDYYTITKGADSAFVMQYGTMYSLNDLFVFPKELVTDIQITLTSAGRIRAGRPTYFYLTYKNIGTNTENGNIDLAFDNRLTYADLSKAEASHTTNSITWNYTNLKPGETRSINLTFTPPTDIAVNTALDFMANISTTNTDVDILNNRDSLAIAVTGSYDPNEKVVLPAGNISPDEVEEQDPFTYVVHFQNTGNDTAFVVVVKDTISTYFEIETIQILASSHPYKFKMKEGAAEFRFENILLPDSTTNEKKSHGFIKYRIVPKNTLQLGDEIKNTAHIFFDYNAAIVTNTTLNRVAQPTAIKNAHIEKSIHVYPNPTKGQFSIRSEISSLQQARVTILDPTGRVMQIIENVDLSGSNVIDLQNEEKGVYYIQILSNDKLVMKKLVVN